MINLLKLNVPFNSDLLKSTSVAFDVKNLSKQVIDCSHSDGCLNCSHLSKCFPLPQSGGSK